jgi:hypothetical protein
MKLFSLPKAEEAYSIFMRMQMLKEEFSRLERELNKVIITFSPQDMEEYLKKKKGVR